MNITIVGGGNVGTQFAVHCAAKGHKVTVFCSKPNQFGKQLSIVDEHGNIVLNGEIQEATSDPQRGFQSAEWIFVTVPAFCMKDSARQIERYCQPSAVICLVPGTGGGECNFLGCIQKGCIVAGLQRVPSVARLIQYGERVCATGYRDTLHIGTIPSRAAQDCANLVSAIFDCNCQTLPNYLNVTLTPSNPILHTSRLYSLFHDYHAGMTYGSIPLFYEEWDDDSSRLLLACDEELQQLCKSIPELDLSYVKSLKYHYESNTTTELTKKIRSIKSLHGLQTPSIQRENGWIPDFQSRYFTADFPYGLAILCDIAQMANVDVPHIRRVLDWYYHITGAQERFQYEKYHIYTYNDLIGFYGR